MSNLTTHVNRAAKTPRGSGIIRPAVGTEVSGSGRNLRTSGYSMAHLNMMRSGLGPRLGLSG